MRERETRSKISTILVRIFLFSLNFKMNKNQWCCRNNEDNKRFHCNNRITLIIISIINFVMTIVLVSLLLQFVVFSPTTVTTTQATTITTTQQPGKNFDK